jgi:hypothetical protein
MGFYIDTLVFHRFVEKSAATMIIRVMPVAVITQPIPGRPHFVLVTDKKEKGIRMRLAETDTLVGVRVSPDPVNACSRTTSMAWNGCAIPRMGK